MALSLLSRGRGAAFLASDAPGWEGCAGSAPLAAMRWLGQPCALPPFLPRGAFQAIGGRFAAGTGGSFPSGAVRAGGAAPGLLPGQVQLRWAVETQLPGRGHQRSGLRLLGRLLRESGLVLRPTRFELSAVAGGDPFRNGTDPRCRRCNETSATKPRQLRPQIAWHATKSDSPAGGEESRGGGPRSNLAPPKVGEWRAVRVRGNARLRLGLA